MSNDVWGLNMETEYDYEWRADQQKHDDDEQTEIREAFNRIYLAADELEALYNCSLPDLRADIRFVELTALQKVLHECE